MPSYIRGNDNFDSANILGQGQTWQNVTASRAKGVTYTNTTGKPIMVDISTYVYADSGVYFIINGVNQGVIVSQSGAAGVGGSMALIVPNGNTYSTSGEGAVSTWFELR